MVAVVIALALRHLNIESGYLIGSLWIDCYRARVARRRLDVELCQIGTISVCSAVPNALVPMSIQHISMIKLKGFLIDMNLIA